jgi:hypothetical protein
MTMRLHPCRGRYEPLFDVDAVTGGSIEVFWADNTLETFGRRGTGWFWHFRRRGFAPKGPAHGPFPTSYSAYRDALISAGWHVPHYGGLAAAQVWS